MIKKYLLLLTLCSLLFLTGCVKGENTSESTSDTVINTYEPTTLNLLPNNEYTEDKKTLPSVELYLDNSKGHETEYYEDGSFSDIYESEDRSFTEKVNYNKDGKLFSYTKTTFDSQGRVSCDYVFSAEKTFDYACLHEYDSLGRYYRYYYYNYDYTLIYYEVVTYDGNGIDKPVELYDAQGNQLDELPDVFDWIVNKV